MKEPLWTFIQPPHSTMVQTEAPICSNTCCCRRRQLYVDLCFPHTPCQPAEQECCSDTFMFTQRSQERPQVPLCQGGVVSGPAIISPRRDMASTGWLRCVSCGQGLWTTVKAKLPENENQQCMSKLKGIGEAQGKVRPKVHFCPLRLLKQVVEGCITSSSSA